MNTVKNDDGTVTIKFSKELIEKVDTKEFYEKPSNAMMFDR